MVLNHDLQFTNNLKENIKILDIPFIKNTKKALLDNVQKTLEAKQKQLFIATPNPEMLLETEKNSRFKKILQNTDLNIPDGIGIIWAAHFLKTIKNNSSKTLICLKFFLSALNVVFAPKRLHDVLPQRITGVDLMKEICLTPAFSNYKIFFLGAEKGIAEKAAQALKLLNPSLKIAGTYSGSPTDEANLEIINLSKADILFVAFGSPKQEIWLKENFQNLPSVQLGMGVGGSFDFIAGKRKRAPSLMQKIGLEWLFRLIQEPRRIKRIYNAAIKFPLLILKKKL